MNRPLTRAFFQATDWLSFGVTVLVLIAIYLWTIAPEVTLEWSGILASGASYGSAPSPPGYPLWVLYAWAFARLLPFSNIAWRLAVSSAVAGALACGVVALIVSRGSLSILRGIKGLRPLPPREEGWVRGVCGTIAGIAFGLQSVFWSHAVIVESTTLAMLLFAIILAFLMRWALAGHGNRFLYAVALTYSLSLDVHVSLAVAAPGFLFLASLRRPRVGRDLLFVTAILLGGLVLAHKLHIVPVLLADASEIGRNLETVYALLAVVAALTCVVLVLITRGLLTEWRTVYFTAVSVAFPLLLYFCLPVASMTNPPVNWAYARTVEGFLHLISRGQFEAASPVTNPFVFASQIWAYARHTVAVFGWVYVAVAATVFYFLRRLRPIQRRWIIGLLGIFLCMSLFMLAMLNPAPDVQSWDLIGPYFCASHLVLAIFAGFGFAIIATLVSRPKTLRDS